MLHLAVHRKLHMTTTLRNRFRAHSYVLGVIVVRLQNRLLDKCARPPIHIRVPDMSDDGIFINLDSAFPFAAGIGEDEHIY